jgi:hypothetical protein
MSTDTHWSICPSSERDFEGAGIADTETRPVSGSTIHRGDSTRWAADPPPEGAATASRTTTTIQPDARTHKAFIDTPDPNPVRVG